MPKIYEKLNEEIKVMEHELERIETLIHQAVEPEEKQRLTYQHIDTMKRKEFVKAIAITRAEISKVEQQIEETTNRREQMYLCAKRRELQYQQVWHMDHVGWNVFKIVYLDLLNKLRQPGRRPRSEAECGPATAGPCFTGR